MTSRLFPLAVAAALLACGGQRSSSAGTASSAALASAVASTTDASGTLLCAPAQGQLDACASLAAGDACTLTAPDGVTTVAGTCRATLDGAAVACAPTPPAPPQFLVDACASLALGDACQVTEPDGDSHAGTCVTARDGQTLVCGRVRTPPAAAVDACATLAAGDACTFSRDGMMMQMAGVCSLGPAGTGPLACSPAQELRPGATAACDGLVAGATCALGGDRFEVSGTCVTPAAGGAAVCVPACRALAGPFACRDSGGMGGGGMGGPGGMMGQGPGMMR